MPLQLGTSLPGTPVTTEPENRNKVLSTAQSLPDGQVDKWVANSPAHYRSASQDLLGCPLGYLDHAPTSEHPGAAGAGHSWGPPTLCQRVATDDQLQDIARLCQERHRQAAVEVPRANVVDLHGAQPRGQTGISSAWAEEVGIVGVFKCGPRPSPDAG